MARPGRPKKKTAEAVVKDIKRQTRRKFSAEEKIRIVIEGLKGEESIAEICRREGIAPALYYRWSKDFIEAGKKRLNGDTEREANTFEVNDYVKIDNQKGKIVVIEKLMAIDEEIQKDSAGPQALLDSLNTVRDRYLNDKGNFDSAYIIKNPGHLLSKFLIAMIGVPYPETLPVMADGKADSTFAFRWYKEHCHQMLILIHH